MMKRDLISINDLTNDEIEQVFAIADELAGDLRGCEQLCRGNIMATLFYEPSTRTRLSFESAMHRLGGNVITVANMKDSSTAKGESLADTVRVVGGNYADLLVIRHPAAGAARVAASFADVPVINAGDGGHEHPTQTLCDLYTLRQQKGHLEGLEVVLCGDLKYSRTVHSLAYALARFGANIICIPAPSFEMPDYVLEKLGSEFRCQPERFEGGEFDDLVEQADAFYITPNRPHQLTLFTDAAESRAQKRRVIKNIDALYMTRAQSERFTNLEEAAAYPRVNEALLRRPGFQDAIVMHPLPRRDEISYEVDRDPRSMYFKQAQQGVPIRMALIAVLLGIRPLQRGPRREVGQVAIHGALRCWNESCITRTEQGGYLLPEFEVVTRQPFRLRCAFCEAVRPASWVGDRSRKRVFPAESTDVMGIAGSEITAFEDVESYEAEGYVLETAR
ncbi:MAG: aspartate carbamoyltransferase [Planctomycetota bacterium]